MKYDVLKRGTQVRAPGVTVEVYEGGHPKRLVGGSSTRDSRTAHVVGRWREDGKGAGQVAVERGGWVQGSNGVVRGESEVESEGVPTVVGSVRS